MSNSSGHKGDYENSEDYEAWKENEKDRLEEDKYTLDQNYVYPSRKELKHPDRVHIPDWLYDYENLDWPFDFEKPEDYEEEPAQRARELGVHPDYEAWKENEKDRLEEEKYTLDQDYVYPSTKELKHPDRVHILDWPFDFEKPEEYEDEPARRASRQQFHDGETSSASKKRNVG